MKVVKEVCVESYDEAIRAEAGGASRIELCENLAVGGTTPSAGTILQCIRKLTVPFFVMIRPRGGNFCYSDDEIEIMKEDIRFCREAGVRGVVFGLLHPDNTIDIKHTAGLVALASPMEVTFHKAIDETPDLLTALDELKTCGIHRILSSGGRATAFEGSEILNRMISNADTIRIIVAGKVTYENFDEIHNTIPSTEYHGRKLVQF